MEPFTVLMPVLATIMGAVIGALIPTIYKRYDDKRIRRIRPSISIWNNMHDDIDARLSNNALRWYLELSKLKDYRANCFYIVARSESDFMMQICEVEISFKMKNNADQRSPQKYNVRLIDSKTRCVFPLIYSDDVKSVIFKITYNTEKNETMVYQASFEIDHSEDVTTKRKDISYIILKNNKEIEYEDDDGTVRRSNHSTIKMLQSKIEKREKIKIKQLELIKMEESENFSSREIKDRLGEHGTLNNLRRG